jgi:hypothetical protein
MTRFVNNPSANKSTVRRRIRQHISRCVALRSRNRSCENGITTPTRKRKRGKIRS